MVHLTGSPRHSVSVAAAVVDGDRVLATRRADNGHWEPPGGVLEADEDVLAGLRREVREETGLELEDVRLSGVYKNMTRGIVALVFRCRSAGGPVEPRDGEVREHRWMTRDEIRTHMDEAYAVRLLDALDEPAVTPVRAHDGTRLL